MRGTGVPPVIRRMAVNLHTQDKQHGRDAHAAHLPECIACGDTLAETRRLIAEAIDLHIRGMIEDNEPVPEPTTQSDYVTVHAA